jgi:hypothetical protein
MFLPSLTPLFLCFLQVKNYPSAKSMLQFFCLYMVDANLLLYMVERPIRRFTVLLRSKMTNHVLENWDNKEWYRSTCNTIIWNFRTFLWPINLELNLENSALCLFNWPLLLGIGRYCHEGITPTLYSSPSRRRRIMGWTILSFVEVKARAMWGKELGLISTTSIQLIDLVPLGEYLFGCICGMWLWYIIIAFTLPILS